MALGAITEYPTGLVATSPSILYISTTDTYATVTATGYLNSAKQLGSTFSNDQMALVYTTDDGPVFLQVVISGSNISLQAITAPGDVLLPTVANHLIVSTNTTGTLANLSGTAINAGSLQAGLSGTAGTVISYPGTASKGSLILAAVANTGNTNTTISNVAMGQASIISIPDPAGATADFVLAPAALVNNNLVKASGTAGLVADAGIATSAVQLNTNIKAQQVTGLGGGGAGPLTVTAAGCTSASVICVNIITSSNTVSVAKVAPGSGNFALTLSGDPGATLTISYIMFIAAQ